MNKEVLTWMIRRMSNGSVGPSTIRGMAPAGTAKIIKTFLRAIDLRSIRTRTAAGFIKRLDLLTDDLLVRLPDGSQHWGMARKCLNIFLRNCVYNRYLCEHYKLEVLEPWLEIPLDSHVGRGLIARVDAEVRLPRWTRVIDLNRELSDLYQIAAQNLAAKMGISRIHLDDWLYQGEHLTGN